MLGGLYSYFFGPVDGGEYQKAEEKFKQLQAQVVNINAGFEIVVNTCSNGRLLVFGISNFI